MIAGHNGNAGAIKDIARELAASKELHNVWYYQQGLDRSLLKLLESPIPCGCVHAGEMETSMMLYAKPEYVWLDKAEAEFPELPEAAKYRPVPWDEYITVGSYGDPTKATPEKGKAFLEAAIGQIVHIIRDVMP